MDVPLISFWTRRRRASAMVGMCTLLGYWVRGGRAIEPGFEECRYC
jgi:hypothetical protein